MKEEAKESLIWRVWKGSEDPRHDGVNMFSATELYI